MKLTHAQKVRIVGTFLDIAHGYRGISRAKNRKQIEKFLKLFGLPFADANGKPYAFCAAGLMYAWCKAIAIELRIPFDDSNAVIVFRTRCLPIITENWLTPSTSCHDIKASAKARGIWRAAEGKPNVDKPTPCLVLFCFNGKHDPDGSLFVQHIGLLGIDKDESDGVILDVEFNTSDSDNANGGAVASRERNEHNVAGYIPLLAA